MDTAVTGLPKELPCRAECTGGGLQWCIIKHDSLTGDVAWIQYIGDGDTMNEGFPLINIDTISIVENGTLAIEEITSLYTFTTAVCNILDDDHREILCSSTIELNIVPGKRYC